MAQKMSTVFGQKRFAAAQTLFVNLDKIIHGARVGIVDYFHPLRIVTP